MSEQVNNEEIARLLRGIVVRNANGQAMLKNVDAVTRKTLEIKRGTTSRIS